MGIEQIVPLVPCDREVIPSRIGGVGGGGGVLLVLGGGGGGGGVLLVLGGVGGGGGVLLVHKGGFGGRAPHGGGRHLR